MSDNDTLETHYTQDILTIKIIKNGAVLFMALLVVFQQVGGAIRQSKPHYHCCIFFAIVTTTITLTIQQSTVYSINSRNGT